VACFLHHAAIESFGGDDVFHGSSTLQLYSERITRERS
jgi:hypothetical protein